MITTTSCANETNAVKPGLETYVIKDDVSESELGGRSELLQG
jgi:hypothetical protein